MQYTTSNNAAILDLAVRDNHRDLVKMILFKHPAYEPERLDSRRSYLSGLIEIAAMKSKITDFVERLLEDNNAVVGSVDNFGWTLLRHAVDNEFDSVLEVTV
ncbi:hypothetical protein POM88_048609 [Heracleum sosnowskyi]|uniref:Ankyrin repeat protein n=1 Tax=Heracleum sosnowskyi TaxID=360622 RepID=A0AAD8M0S7_9APIA|nr:hypothetical protein POM88_048609 [Heracleum sosnowskyi]